jgi:hypothetical protein
MVNTAPTVHSHHKKDQSRVRKIDKGHRRDGQATKRFKIGCSPDTDKQPAEEGKHGSAPLSGIFLQPVQTDREKYDRTSKITI